MSKPILITAEPFKDSFKLTIPSEYNRLRVKDMVRSGKVTLFELNPRVRASKEQRGYLEGAVIPDWANWQYNLDPREPKNRDTARFLFKQHFHYDVVKDKDGNPRRVPKSLGGKHAEALDTYTSWAQENGAPVPNEKLYLMWRDEFSMDLRWQNYYDWLDFMELETDSMPSREYIDSVIKKQNEKD